MNATIEPQRLAARKKWKRFLQAIYESPKTSRELELAPVFDHCAHSTASELRKKGIGIDTEIVEIRGYAGEPARIARYSLAAESRERARAILNLPRGHGDDAL
jgi:hypothetical protein